MNRKVSEWQAGFKNLYSGPDKKRKPEEFWTATMAHLSCIGEAIRRTHYKELVASSVHAFCWMCSYITKCNNVDDSLFRIENNFGEIVGLKFPSICGHCQKTPCRCNPYEMDSQKDKSSKYSELYIDWNRLRLAFSSYTINQWLEHFWKIYSGQIHMLTFENIGFHLLEEAGEEAMAVRQLIQFRGVEKAGYDCITTNFLKTITKIPDLVSEYTKCVEKLKKLTGKTLEKEAFNAIKLTDNRADVIKARLIRAKMNFVIEFADTFSWFCAVLLKLREIINNEELDDEIKKNFDIGFALMDRYQSCNAKEPLKCYACGEKKCKCINFFDRRKT